MLIGENSGKFLSRTQEIMTNQRKRHVILKVDQKMLGNKNRALEVVMNTIHQRRERDTATGH